MQNNNPDIQFYKNLIDFLPYPIFYKDIKGKYIGCNLAFENFTGLARNKIIGKTVHDVYPKELADIYFVKDQELLSNPGKQEFESKTKDKNGSTRDVIFSKVTYKDSNDIVIGLIGSIYDITKRKNTERKLKRLSKAMIQNPSAVIITNKVGEIEYVNPKFEDLSGYRLSEVTGLNPKILNSGEQSKEHYKELWETIQKGETWKGEFKNKKKNGEFYWAQANISGIVDSNNEIEFYVGVQEDITQQKTLKEKLEDNLENIRMLIRLLIHDIANPLTVIQGNAIMLGKSEGNQNYSKSITQSVTIITEIIKNVRRMQGLDSGKLEIKKEHVNVKNVFRDILLIFDDVAKKKNIKLNIKYFTDDEILVIAEKSSLTSQVLSNLISNAIKFSYSGSRIDINVNDTENEIIIEVKDYGIGIPNDLTEVIFDPHKKTTRTGTNGEKGVGFGMPLVKTYIDKYGGRIEVLSIIKEEQNKNHGTTFTVYLNKV